jgi:hypothetical protein
MLEKEAKENAENGLGGDWEWSGGERSRVEVIGSGERQAAE